MRKYKIWDKQSDIYTLGRDANGKAHWTAEDYISEYAPWAANPAIKVIVGGGAINGTVFMEFESTVDFYQRQGAAISADMNDEEKLIAIEQFEDRPPVAQINNEARIADALEILAAETQIEQIFAILEGDE